MTAPLMPKATAVWLIDNTALTFDQIAVFCGLHPLEVKGIANDDVAQGIKGTDPISNGQLTRDEIERCQSDPSAYLQLAESKRDMPAPKVRQGARYTPLSKRQERPDAIAWLLRNHPELNDAEIGRLVGTTKPTIKNIRDRTHWNMANITPVDPVALGLCSQIDLDENVVKAAQREERRCAKLEREAVSRGETLKPAEETTAIGPIGAENVPISAHKTESLHEKSQNVKINSVFTDDADAPSAPDADKKLRPEDVFKTI